MLFEVVVTRKETLNKNIVDSIPQIRLCKRYVERIEGETLKHITFNYNQTHNGNMTLPETVEHHHYREEHVEEEDTLSDCDDIFGPARTILRRTKTKISMISNELRLREKRKRVLQLCLRKLERIKDSENNLRRSVCIHNTFSRLTADIKRDKERGQNRNQHQQQQPSYK